MLALLIGKTGDTRQDQQAVRAQVLGVEQLIVHHLKRNARLDEGLVNAVDGVVYPPVGIGRGVMPGSLLTVDEADTSEVAGVTQVGFIGVVPAIDVLDWF